MRRIMYIMFTLLCFGCANNTSKTMKMENTEAFEIEEEESSPYFSETDAYSILIQQKLQEHLDKKALLKTNPDFNIETKEYKFLSIKNGGKLKNIEFISPFKIVSDSVKKVAIKVVLEHETDTILTRIKTSVIEIDGEQLLSTKVSFDTIPKKQY